MTRNLVTLCFAIHCIFIQIAGACECLSTDDVDNYKCHLGTRTPYRYTANYNDSQLKYQGCTEKKMWLLIRHGTRFPGKKVSSQMIRTLPKFQQKIVEYHNTNKSMIPSEVVHDIINWRLNVTMDDHTKLTDEGGRELVDLAERFQSRFPTLLPEIYGNHSYKFKRTPTQRTEESARYFTLGLFGLRGSQQVWYHPAEKKDAVLRPYKQCERWLLDVDNNPTAQQEKNWFIESEVVNQTLEEISKLLGFPINYDDASLMYKACGFETAWTRNANSPWCRVFSLENFKVMEYVEDLDTFWIDGYGFPLSYQQLCPTLRDVFRFFESETSQKATIYFSHSGSILKLLALLGLAKDTVQPTHSSSGSHLKNRAWRVSRIDAFASNIAFVLYDCENDGLGIAVMHQERVVHIPGCPEGLPCPISVMDALFSQSIHECHFERMCEEDRRQTGRYIAGGTALAVTLLALHHVFLRGSSNLAGIFIPAIIMSIYVVWVLYSARRDRQKAARRASAMELVGVVNIPSKAINPSLDITTDQLRKHTQDIT